jgi:hypothetical protein
VKKWDRGALGVVGDHAKTFRLRKLLCDIGDTWEKPKTFYSARNVYLPLEHFFENDTMRNFIFYAAHQRFSG